MANSVNPSIRQSPGSTNGGETAPAAQTRTPPQTPAPAQAYLPAGDTQARGSATQTPVRHIAGASIQAQLDAHLENTILNGPGLETAAVGRIRNMLEAIVRHQSSVGAGVYAGKHYDTGNADNLFHARNAALLENGLHGEIFRLALQATILRTLRGTALESQAQTLRNHASLNAEPSVELLEKLDALLEKYQNILEGYSHAASLEAWKTAVAPIVLTINDLEAFRAGGALAELRQAMSEHEREFSVEFAAHLAERQLEQPNPSEKLPGVNVGNGIALSSQPGHEQVAELLEAASSLDPETADVFAEVLLTEIQEHTLTPEGFAAFEHVAAELRAGAQLPTQSLSAELERSINAAGQDDVAALILGVLSRTQETGQAPRSSNSMLSLAHNIGFLADASLTPGALSYTLNQLLEHRSPPEALDLRDLGYLGSIRERSSSRKVALHRCRRCGKYTWDVDEYCMRRNCRRPSGTALAVWLEAAAREERLAEDDAGEFAFFRPPAS